ncbi:adenylyl-sulfate kinase [Paraburkholderia tropica]|uniref:adenylyl-sulfate kinase n=1 Tax=Paraburkholderia tropica TaxID=92647 RepID=UPI002AB10B53|nr:adenylyl-sulfate kinase [Paraburkholderia tropica]
METVASSGAVVWLTGMSGAGKSTIAQALLKRLHMSAVRAMVLDGDVLRTGLNSDLGYSDADRTENLRRVAHVAAMFCQEGYVAITATISPELEHRENARKIIGADSFVEVFVDTPLRVCESRDPKGLYKRARAGQIASFTGISSPYHAPEHADIVLHTESMTVDHCVAQIIEHLTHAREARLI